MATIFQPNLFQHGGLFQIVEVAATAHGGHAALTRDELRRLRIKVKRDNLRHQREERKRIKFRQLDLDELERALEPPTPEPVVIPLPIGPEAQPPIYSAPPSIDMVGMLMQQIQAQALAQEEDDIEVLLLAA